jgi:hypothetical protein
VRHITAGDVILASIGALVIASLVLSAARDLRRDSGAMPRFWPLDSRPAAAVEDHDADVQRWREARGAAVRVLPLQSCTGWDMSAVIPGAVFGGCRHADAVPVRLSVTGEKVAVLCPDCDAQLPAEWEAL